MNTAASAHLTAWTTTDAAPDGKRKAPYHDVGRSHDWMENLYHCRWTQDPALAERYGIDFVLDRLDGLDVLLRIGVRLAPELGDVADQERFVHALRQGVVPRGLFVEVSRAAEDLGAHQLLVPALLAYAFDHRYRDMRAGYLRFALDATYQIVSLEDHLRRASTSTLPSAAEPRVEGRIIAYFAEKGFGFIEDDTGEKYFFHVIQVEDDALRATLTRFLPGERLSVSFVYGGHDGRRYPKALSLRPR